MPSSYTVGKVNLTYLDIPEVIVEGVGLCISYWIQAYDALNDSKTIITQEGRPTLSELKKEYSSNFTFTIVRNPWDRALVGYNSLSNMLSLNDKKNVATSIGLPSWPNFGQFLENLSILEAPLSKFFTVPITTNQSYWIDDTIDLIIKIENIDTDIAPIEAMVSNGSVVELHSLYVNNYIGNYKDFYTKTTEEIIRNLFAEDIGKFNYTFGG